MLNEILNAIMIILVCAASATGWCLILIPYAKWLKKVEIEMGEDIHYDD